LEEDLVDLGTLGDAELLALVSFGDEDVGHARSELAVELLALAREVYRADPDTPGADGETRHRDDVALLPRHGFELEGLEPHPGVFDVHGGRAGGEQDDHCYERGA